MTDPSQRSGTDPPRIVAIGEVLWDRFPDAVRLGGAPANAAVHAAALGASATMVSRVGDDADGRETINRLYARGVDVEHIQVDAVRKTGAALVSVDAKGEPAFEIVEGVAWDAIEWTDGLTGLAAEADAVCFGTLGQRCEPSGDTIRRFVTACPEDALRCLDLNLRQHYHSPKIIEASLKLANALKLSREELSDLSKTYGEMDDAPRTVGILREAFSLEWVAVTLGGEGCRVFGENADVEIPGVRVDVADTVGAGDAFTAGLMAHLLRGDDLPTAAKWANELGAYVASCDGATPRLPQRFNVFD